MTEAEEAQQDYAGRGAGRGRGRRARRGALARVGRA